MFEVRTGRLLKSFRIDGRGSHDCPVQIGLGDSRKIAQGFDGGVLKARLRGLVEGRAPTRR